MKLGIRQKVLMDALNKGAVAAISEDAQGDTSNLALLMKSIKVTIDEKKFTVESNTDLMAVKYSVPVGKDDGIVVKEGGCVLLPAKEIIDWAKVQGEESTINISLNKLANPEVINTLEDIGVTDGADKFMVKKIGSVKLSSKDLTKTSGRWELDCYDPEQVKSINFGGKSDKCFTIQGKQLGEALGSVSCASVPKDYEHVLDSVSLQTYKENLYLATTDTQRCALYKVPSDQASDIQSKQPLLIPFVLLDQVAKIINKEESLSFSYNSESEKVFITQKNLKVRLASTERANIEKFPNIEMLLEKDYQKLTTIPKSSINKVLVSAAIVNNSSALFSFKKDSETMTVKAISEDNKYKPNVSQCGSPDAFKDFQIVWGVTHLIEGLKAIKSDEVELHVPKNMQSLKILGKGDDSFSYFAMVIDNPKYSLETS